MSVNESNQTTEAPESAGSSRRALLKGAVAAGVAGAVYTSPVISAVPAYATHGLSSFTAQATDKIVWFSPNQVKPGGNWVNISYDSSLGTTNNEDASKASVPPSVDGVSAAIPDDGSAVSRLVTMFKLDSGAKVILALEGTPNNRRTDQHPTGGGSSGGTSDSGNDNSSIDEYGSTSNPVPSYAYYGGGVKISLSDDATTPTYDVGTGNCEMKVIAVFCNGDKIGPGSANAPPTPWKWGASRNVIPNSTSPPGSSSNPLDPTWQNGAPVYYHTGRTGLSDAAFDAVTANRCKFGLKFDIRCR